MYLVGEHRKFGRGVIALAIVAMTVVAVWKARWFFAPTVAGRSDAIVQGAPEAPTEITARGRLEPKDRVINVAGPSQPTVFVNVMCELYVKEGDTVTAGQVIGIFDSYASKEAAVARLRAELSCAQLEYRRFERL